MAIRIRRWKCAGAISCGSAAAPAAALQRLQGVARPPHRFLAEAVEELRVSRAPAAARAREHALGREGLRVERNERPGAAPAARAQVVDAKLDPSFALTRPGAAPAARLMLACTQLHAGDDASRAVAAQSRFSGMSSLRSSERGNSEYSYREAGIVGARPVRENRLVMNVASEQLELVQVISECRLLDASSKEYTYWRRDGNPYLPPRLPGERARRSPPA